MSPSPARCVWQWRRCALSSLSFCVEFFVVPMLRTPHGLLEAMASSEEEGAACNPKLSGESFSFCVVNEQSSEATTLRTVSTPRTSGHRQDSHNKKLEWEREGRHAVADGVRPFGIIVQCHVDVRSRRRRPTLTTEGPFRERIVHGCLVVLVCNAERAFRHPKKAVRVTVANLFWNGRVVAAASVSLYQSRAH